MKKALLAAAVITALTLLAWIIFGNRAPSEQGQNQPQVQAPDTSASIQKDIESLKIKSPDGEFKTIDADLNQL